jgi:hypothetical protein
LRRQQSGTTNTVLPTALPHEKKLTINNPQKDK